MKKIALLLTLACSASFAADWRKVGETERGDVHIDAASIAQKGNIRQVLVMGNYKDAVETGGAENFSFKSYVDLSQYNCKAKTTAIVQEILYAEHDAKGATNHYNPPISKPNYLAPPPNSLSADILQFVCAYPLRKK
jgi:hypothetical protein